tara:strand:+ start:15840 stop:16319 length:480 start_codon:yes stop_codon:yes gene_type:complete
MARPKHLGVFYAHSATDRPSEIATQRVELEDFLKKRFLKKFGDSSPAVYVISGRKEHRMTWRGDWEAWQKKVVTRRHSTTGDICYHMFVVPSEYCGRATAGILDNALQAERDLFLWDRDGEKLMKVTGVQAVDADDWTRGYRVIVNGPKNEKSNPRNLS